MLVDDISKSCVVSFDLFIQIMFGEVQVMCHWHLR